MLDILNDSLVQRTKELTHSYLQHFCHNLYRTGYRVLLACLDSYAMQGTPNTMDYNDLDSANGRALPIGGLTWSSEGPVLQMEDAVVETVYVLFKLLLIAGLMTFVVLRIQPVQRHRSNPSPSLESPPQSISNSHITFLAKNILWRPSPRPVTCVCLL